MSNIPEYLKKAINERRDELGIPGNLWLWFEKELIQGRCVVLSIKGTDVRIGAINAVKQKYFDL